MRLCAKCKQVLEPSMFYAVKTGRDGLHSWCKGCVGESQREYRQANAGKLAARNKAYRGKNRERLNANDRAYHEKYREDTNAKSRAYYEAHKEEIIAYQKRYAKDHPEQVGEYKRRNKVSRPDTIKAEYERNKTAYFARAAERRASKVSQMPAWADQEVIAEYYKVARAFNAMRPDIGFHVDHIVPLKSKLVCGLHAPANLQILTSKANLSKHNRHWPQMP